MRMNQKPLGWPDDIEWAEWPIEEIQDVELFSDDDGDGDGDDCPPEYDDLAEPVEIPEDC